MNTKTRYAIKNVVGDIWLDQHNKWHGRERALTFEFMTTALAYAINAGLNMDHFTVEAV